MEVIVLQVMIQSYRVNTICHLHRILQRYSKPTPINVIECGLTRTFRIKPVDAGFTRLELRFFLDFRVQIHQQTTFVYR